MHDRLREALPGNENSVLFQRVPCSGLRAGAIGRGELRRISLASVAAGLAQEMRTGVPAERPSFRRGQLLPDTPPRTVFDGRISKAEVRLRAVHRVRIPPHHGYRAVSDPTYASGLYTQRKVDQAFAGIQRRRQYRNCSVGGVRGDSRYRLSPGLTERSRIPLHVYDPVFSWGAVQGELSCDLDRSEYSGLPPKKTHSKASDLRTTGGEGPSLRTHLPDL